MPKVYAGIGSRSTPLDILDLIQRIAAHLSGHHWILRSGHAPGADQAFERGAGRRAELYLPWPDFEKAAPHLARTIVTTPTREAHSLSATHHPSWATLKQGAKQLHARNAHQVLGLYLDRPAEFVMCWTPDAKGGGGTGQAIRIARAHGVRVYDLADDAVRAKVERTVAAWSRS